MKILVFAAFIAVVSSGQLNSKEQVGQPETPWQTGKLYRYEVEISTRTSLQEGATSGSSFKAVFNIHSKAENQLIAKLENPRSAAFNEAFQKNQELPANLQYESVNNLDQPFEITLDGGRVLNLKLPASWILNHENLLKGLISALQVDLTTHRNIPSNHELYDREAQQGLFRKMETDVTGDCETLYSVSPMASEWRRELPKYFSVNEPVEIKKSKNYGHCHHRVDYHYGVPSGAEWSGLAHKNSEEQIMQRATTSRILRAKQGPIHKVETVSTVYVHPHLDGKQKAEVLSIVRLMLVNYQDQTEPEWQITQESRIVQNLLYSVTNKQTNINENSIEHNEPDSTNYRFRFAMHKSSDGIRKIINKYYNDESASNSIDSAYTFTNDDLSDSNEPAYAALYMNNLQPSDKMQNAINSQKLVQELAQQLQKYDNMPKADFLSKFNILVRLIASMSLNQLSQTSKSIEAGRTANNVIKSDMWMIYRDAVTQAGTLPAFQQIKKWIETKQLQGEEAAQVVSTMVRSLRYPTKQVVNQLFQLALNPEVSQQKWLNSTILISVTRLMNMAHVNNETAHSFYPTHMYGRLIPQNDRFVVDEILPRLSKDLKQYIEQGNSHKAQVQIRAIGNVGHREILAIFAPYLEGKIPVNTYLRTLMVYSLDVLASQEDHYVRSVLYSLLRNTAEPYEVRVAAAHNIFMANPTGSMMMAMAQMTHDDPSVHVRAVLKSGILTSAQLQSPRYAELSRTARSVQSMVTKDNLENRYSAKEFSDVYDMENDFTLLNVVSATGSQDSFIPKYYRHLLQTKAGRFDRKSTISALFSSIKQLDTFYQQLLHPQQQKSTQTNHKFSAEKITEMLNIKRNPENPLEASLFLDLENQQRFIVLSEDDLKQIPKYHAKVLEDLQNGIETHYTKIWNQDQVSIMFPLSSGMPFVYKYKEPTVLHIQGKVKGQINTLKTGLEASVEKEIQFTYARNIDGSVGFLDTLSNQYASAGVINKLQINIPVKVQTQIKSGEVKMTFEPLRTGQDTTLVHYSVWPYTANQKKDTLVPISQDSATKMVERSNRINNIDAKIGQNIGAVFQLQGYSYSNDYLNIGTKFPSRDYLSNLAALLYQRDIALTHYNLKYLGKQSQAKTLGVTIVYDKHQNQNQDGQMNVQATNMQDATPSSSSRREQMIKRVASGVNAADVHIVDLSAVIDGAQKSEFVATWAMAHSPVDNKVQYSAFASSNIPKQGQKQINLVGKVVKPKVSSMNFLEALKNDLKFDYEADLVLGNQENNGNVHLQGHGQRTSAFTEQLMKSQWGQQCAQESGLNNLYQNVCHKMILIANAPNSYKASVAYKGISLWWKNMSIQAARIAQHLGFWYTEINPMKVTGDGKLQIEIEASYLENYMNMMLDTNAGSIRINRLPIPKSSAMVLSVYPVLSNWERFMNFYSGHHYQPYCSVDGSQIRTFSNRTYNYPLSSSYHVVMQDDAKQASRNGVNDEQLVVLARRPKQNQQEVYISYQSGQGQDLEIEIQPSNDKPVVKVNTNAKKVTEGKLTTYWDNTKEMPLLQNYILPDGVLVVAIRENRLRIMYDGQRLVVLSRENRNNIRGLCGFMSNDPLDDYMTPDGLVDEPKYYGASYSLQHEGANQVTVQLQNESKGKVYQPKHQYTAILRGDNEWNNFNQQSQSSEETTSSQNVYRSRSYIPMTGSCKIVKQVQFYENQGEICISTAPVPACSSNCSGQEHKLLPVQVVCRPQVDQQHQSLRDLIRNGHNPQVSGVPQMKQYRVPSTCV